MMSLELLLRGSLCELGFQQEADGTLRGLFEESLMGAVYQGLSRIKESQQVI